MVISAEIGCEQFILRLESRRILAQRFKKRSNQKGEKKSSENGKNLEEVEIEKREKPIISAEVEPIPKNERERTPKKTQKKVRYVIKIKGKRYEFNHDFLNLGKDAGWKEVNLTKEKGLEIFTNIDFPAFHATKDVVFYAVMSIAEALAEIIIVETQGSIEQLNEIKEAIMRQSSIVITQMNENYEDSRQEIFNKLLFEKKKEAL